MACSFSSRCERANEPTDELEDLRKHCNSSFPRGTRVKVVNVQKRTDIWQTYADIKSNCIWLVSGEIGSMLYSKYGAERFWEFPRLLTSLCKELPNSSSETIRTFREFVTRGDNSLKRTPPNNYPNPSEDEPSPPIKKPKPREKEGDASTSTATGQTTETSIERPGQAEYEMVLNAKTSEGEIAQMDRFTTDERNLALEALECLRVPNTYLTTLTFRKENVRGNVRFQLTQVTLDVKKEATERAPTDFEDYFITEDAESSCSQALLDSRMILEGEGNLLEAVMEGAFEGFDIYLFRKYENSRVSSTLCEKFMDKLLARTIRNYTRIVYVLEERDGDPDKYTRKVQKFWKNGNWREMEFFKELDGREAENTASLKPWIEGVERKTCTEDDATRYFETFLLFCENLELIMHVQKRALLDFEKMTYAERERYLLNIYVTRTILEFLYSRFLNGKNIRTVKQNVLSLYYTVLESTCDGQPFKTTRI